MSKWLWPAVGVAAFVLAAPAGAEQPPAPLMHAELQTAQANGLHVTMAMSMRVAGQALDFSASGVERPKAHQASMVVDMTNLSPTIGKMRMLSIGSRYYLHYDLLDSLRVTHPQVRPWIVTNTAAAVGFDPWALGDLHSSMDAASGYRLLGTSGGISHYRASIDLQSALSSNPQLKKLLGSAGTAVSALLRRPVPVELYVGSDGYLHRVVERITMAIAGDSLSMTIDIGLSDFNVDPGPLVAPSADQVMTLAQFKRLVHG